MEKQTNFNGFYISYTPNALKPPTTSLVVFEDDFVRHYTLCGDHYNRLCNLARLGLEECMNYFWANKDKIGES